MSDFYGYDQHPDAHPTRPWWRRVCTAISETWGWQREADHHFVADPPPDRENPPTCYEEELELYEPGLSETDREVPSPAPAPKCGQVWVDPAAGEAQLVTAVRPATAVRSPKRLTRPCTSTTASGCSGETETAGLIAKGSSSAVISRSQSGAAGAPRA